MTLFQQMPILPERKSFGAELAGSLGETAGRFLPQELSQQLENAALKKQGFNLAGVRDPTMRQQLAQMQMQRMQRLAEGMVKEGLSRKPQPPVVPPQVIKPDATPSATKPDATLEEINERIASKQQSEIERQVAEAQAFGIVPDVGLIRERQTKYGDIFQDALLKTGGTVLAPRLDSLGNPLLDDKGKPILENVGDPTAYSEELKAIARELGQNAYSSGKDEQTIRREATQLANRIANAKDQAQKILAPSIKREIQEFFKGNLSRTSEKKLIASASSAIKPFVEIGAAGEAREYLARAGWNPEQIESIIQKASGTGFSESTRNVLATLPQFQQPEMVKFGPRKGEVYGAKQLPESAYPAVQEALFSILESDPNANLILLRKEFEKKGVDWQTFKQAVDEAVVQKRINNRSKAYQYAEKVLTKPPLSILDTIFFTTQKEYGGRG